MSVASLQILMARNLPVEFFSVLLPEGSQIFTPSSAAIPVSAGDSAMMPFHSEEERTWIASDMPQSLLCA